MIEQALAELEGLDALPLAEQLDRLSATQDVLAGVLERSRDSEGVQAPIPGVRRRQR